MSRVGFRMATVHSVDQQKVPDFIPTKVSGNFEFGDMGYGFNASWDNLAAFKKPSKLIAIRY